MTSITDLVKDNKLTDRGREILAFEARNWATARPGRKEAAIRTELGLTSITYYLALHQLCDTRAALEANAPLINRLRRGRAAGRVARFRRADLGRPDDTTGSLHHDLPRSSYREPVDDS